MYKAKCYVGKYGPGDRIPEGYLTEKRAEQLMKAGAIERIAPVIHSAAEEEAFHASAAARQLSPETEDAADHSPEMPGGDEGEEKEAEAEDEAEAPEIDLMDGIVAEEEPSAEKKTGRGGRRK